MKQPSLQARKDYMDVVEDSVTIVPIPGTRKSVKLHWIKPYTMERITKVWIEREMASASIENGAEVLKDLAKEPYFAFKEAALMILNNDIKIRLFYGLLWRWLSFRYNETQIAPIVAAGKKKTSCHSTLRDYGVLAGYENGHDEDDKERVRAVPSRTSLGCEAAFCKDFPEYGRPRWRLFRWERDFGYRCILTCAQIEIMQSDLPHTLYMHGDSAPVNKDDKAFSRQEEANRKARERKMARQKAQQGYTTEEIFKK